MALREAGNFENYEEQENGTYICRTCGSEIKAVTVTHPVHWRMTPGAGFGEVTTSKKPYCPNCEVKPSEYGEIVYTDF